MHTERSHSLSCPFLLHRARSNDKNSRADDPFASCLRDPRAGILLASSFREMHMRNQLYGHIRIWSVLTFGLICSMPALAMDPACQAPWAAEAGLKNKPFHMYMTSEDKYASANLSKAAATIGAAGVKTSEEIWTGKDAYVLTRGKWIDMKTSFAEMSQDDKDDPDIKKAREAERCRTLPDEAAFGQPTTVYQMHNPELGVDTKIWVSKNSHLPIKSEITTHVGPMTSFKSARYDYGNVQAPANPISMQDMVKRR